MQDFTEEHANSLLNKEWLTKVDNERSTAYLFKFYSSTVDLSCCLMVTDTRLVWAEGSPAHFSHSPTEVKFLTVLSSKQFARRWRSCNHASDTEFANCEDEDTWRATKFELLSRAHTLGGITDTSFKVIESNYSDFAFQMQCGGFVWRWETNYLGHKRSSEIISKHLIFPLISLSHMAISSAESISEMSDTDVEKAVDRMGRSARRTVDTHLKHALSSPRMATTIRRISAMFNFASDLSAIFSVAETPSLEPQTRSEPPRFHTPDQRLVRSPNNDQGPSQQCPSLRQQGSHDVQMDSATESEPEDSPEKRTSPVHVETSAHLFSNTPSVIPEQPMEAAPTIDPVSDSDTPHVRPIKKHKAPVSAEEGENSDAERRKNLQQVKSGNGGPSTKRTVRQPIKRDKLRF